jgi:hypothetical protein
MRNQKTTALPVPPNNPVNKLRRDPPQVQAGVKPKQPGKAFQTDGGKAALKDFFKQKRRGG